MRELYEDTANAQAAAAQAQARATEEQTRANINTELGQRQERLKNAIEHLGSSYESVRMGGAYELFHLAQDIPDLRQTILDILCAHIRQTTGQEQYQKEYSLHPSEEIQTLLTLLFVRDHNVFELCEVDLKKGWLCGADLFQARLDWADLSDAQLQNTSFSGAQLRRANLFGAQLRASHLVGAHLYGACLYGAQLHGANLGKAVLYGADLFDAQLQGVNLAMVQMQGAIVGGAHLQGAYLRGTDLRGVSSEENTSRSTEELIRKSIDRQSDLAWTYFSGGLTSEDVDSFAHGLPDEEQVRLREELAPHVCEPRSTELPVDCDAIVGSYSASEAEKWIEDSHQPPS